MLLQAVNDPTHLLGSVVARVGKKRHGRRVAKVKIEVNHGRAAEKIVAGPGVIANPSILLIDAGIRNRQLALGGG